MYLPVISRAPDAAQQRAQHLIGELPEPVSGKAKDPLRFPGLRPRLRFSGLRPALGLRCLRRMLGLAGRPGVRVTVHREAENPVSLFPVAGHRSASEVAGRRQSPAWLTGPGPGNAFLPWFILAALHTWTDRRSPAIRALGGRAGRLSG